MDKKYFKLKIAFIFLFGVIFTAIFLFNYDFFFKTKDILTEQERGWLNNHKGLIRIAITQIPPQVILTKNGNFEGLAIDYIRLIENKINIKFHLVYYDSWNILLEKVKERDSDIIFAAQKTPEREKFIQFTAPYIYLPNLIIVNQNRKGSINLKDLGGLKVGVVKGSAVHEYLKNSHADLNLKLLNDELDVLNNTSFGETDAAVMETSRASYYIQLREITNLRIAGSADYEYQLRFASRNDWPILNTILEKSLMSITHDEHEKIKRKWLSINDGILAEKYRKLFNLAIVFVFVIISFFIIVSAWNKILHNKVKERTEELNEYKNHLENLVENRTAALKQSNEELKIALSKVEILSGFIPICASCKKVRDDHGYWDQIEVYISKHSSAEFSHSICPECAKKLYGKEKWFKKNDNSGK